MGGPVLNFFQLVLGVSSHFAPNVADKRIGFPQAFPQKGFEFFPGQEGSSVTFGLSLVLLPAIKNPVLQKGRRKKYAFMTFSPGSLKMVFTLLKKVIAFHMQIPIIKVGVPSLEKPMRSLSKVFSRDSTGAGVRARAG